MNKQFSRLAICLLFSILFLSTQSFASGDAPSNSIRTMATVLNYLNHYPGSEEKAKLRKILNNKRATAHEKTIATAILNLQHSATDSDKRKLANVMSSGSASHGAKDLAKIIKSMSHKPSSSDKKMLKNYMW